MAAIAITSGPFYAHHFRVPKGLEDVSKYPSLLAELLDSDRRWTEEDIKKLAGGNLLRVFRAVERVCLIVK